LKVLDILEKAGMAAGELVDLLEMLAERYPDLADAIREKIVQLETAVLPENLAALGAAIPGELLNIVKGKIEPKDHPADLA
jgi:hypothetical protein